MDPNPVQLQSTFCQVGDLGERKWLRLVEMGGFETRLPVVRSWVIWTGVREVWYCGWRGFGNLWVGKHGMGWNASDCRQTHVSRDLGGENLGNGLFLVAGWMENGPFR